MKEIIYGQLMELGFTNSQAEEIIEAMEIEEDEI